MFPLLKLLPESFCGLTVASQSPWWGEDFPTKTVKCLSPCWDCSQLAALSWVYSSESWISPFLWAQLNLWQQPVWGSVAKAGWWHSWLGPQPGLKWLWPTEEQLCYRRNTEWERVDRNRYGHKLGLCFQKCKVFPPDSHCGSRNMNWKWLCVPQMSGRNCYLFFHQDFAFWVLLFPSMLARSKTELSLNPLKSEIIYLQIWAH